MTRDEFCQLLLDSGFVQVDPIEGLVLVNRGPGGIEVGWHESGITHPSGYRVGSYKLGDTRKQVRLHRLVWISVNGSIPSGMTIDHINNIKTDNRIENLQLMTAAANSTKAHQDGLCTGNKGRTKIPHEDYVTLLNMVVSGQKTQADLAREYGVTRGRVGQIVRALKKVAS